MMIEPKPVDFDRLFTNFRIAILRFMRGKVFLSNGEDAEDVAQSLCLTAWKNDEYKALLVEKSALLQRKVLPAYFAKAVLRTVQKTRARNRYITNRENLPDVICPRQTISAGAEATGTLTRVKSELDHDEIFLLERKEEGCTELEIIKQMRCSSRTVRVRWRRLKRKIRRIIPEIAA